MKPTAIRVFPLGRYKERKAFWTRERAVNYFCNVLKSRENPRGRFNLRNDPKFIKGSLILFQYTERKDEEEIIAHAILKSNGFIKNDNDTDKIYKGYYQLDVDSINFYNKPITKKDICTIWRKCLYMRSRLKLDVSKYDDYIELLKSKNNLKSRCEEFSYIGSQKNL